MKKLALITIGILLVISGTAQKVSQPKSFQEESKGKNVIEKSMDEITLAFYEYAPTGQEVKDLYVGNDSSSVLVQHYALFRTNKDYVEVSVEGDLDGEKAELIIYSKDYEQSDIRYIILRKPDSEIYLKVIK